MSDRDAQFRKEMGDQTTAFKAEIASLGNTMTAQISGIAADVKKKGEIPWQAYGLLLTGAGMLFYLMYSPIQKEQADLADENREQTLAITKLVDTIRDGYISRTEFEGLTARGKEQRDRQERDIQELRSDVKGIVSRDEHAERARTIDSRFIDIQRQLDEVKRSQGETYTARDAIMDLKDQVKALQDERRARP